MANGTYSRLTGNNVTFASMIKHFGVVTVMNAKVYKKSDILSGDFSNSTAEEVLTAAQAATVKAVCELKYLKIANVTLDGPTKTVTGGQYANPLIKYGKTATMEIQDALGENEALEFLGGMTNEYTADPAESGAEVVALHNSSEFATDLTLIGETFFIDKESGKQVKVSIVFYDFLPDSLTPLTQDAEGDASVFDMNGSLLMTDIQVGTDGTNKTSLGVFYSILEYKAKATA